MGNFCADLIFIWKTWSVLFMSTQPQNDHSYEKGGLCQGAAMKSYV